jgi:hypothetical protein
MRHKCCLSPRWAWAIVTRLAVLLEVLVAPGGVCVGLGLEPSECGLWVQGPKVDWLSTLFCFSAKTKLGEMLSSQWYQNAYKC